MKQLKVICKKENLNAGPLFFNSDEKLNDFIKREVDGGSFGKSAHWHRPKNIHEPIAEGWTNSREVTTQIGQEEFEVVTEYFYPAEYTVEIKDLSKSFKHAKEEHAKNIAKEFPKHEDMLKALFLNLYNNDDIEFNKIAKQIEDLNKKYPEPKREDFLED